MAKAGRHPSLAAYRIREGKDARPRLPEQEASCPSVWELGLEKAAGVVACIWESQDDERCPSKHPHVRSCGARVQSVELYETHSK
ncbi:hypothetical protein FA13DRAFT_1730534 [Coprinellus micaceus]|uniref:Uncharacterized protein n=1 Tax=Coprinellus micaceus TaxID=71717 RepID=A0A4Y7THN5_COPMI|nr:hypothetical protein FA13DRAFT_1730534 [Coprinellus micaceus]